MQIKIPTKAEFEWAAFLYNGYGFDDAYLDTLEKLKKSKLNGKPGGDLIEFLNKWRTRTRKNAEGDINLWYKLKGAELLEQLKGPLLTTNFNKRKTQGLIKGAYNGLLKINGIGPTGTSKILHMLKPELFVAWDTPIKKYYLKNPYKDSGDGYIFFIQTMKQLIEKMGFLNEKEVTWLSKGITKLYTGRLEMYKKYHNGDKDYLTQYKAIQKRRDLLGIEGKTMAKFIDEYNWVTITNNAPLPPYWHPCDGSKSSQVT